MADILVAADPEPRAVVERVLKGHGLFFVETLEQAEHFLRERRFDLIICTMVFDESRMFELLQLAKSSPEWRSIPFVCARVRSHVLQSPTVVKAAALTCRTLGGDAFLDIGSFHVNPEREMRSAIEGVLGITS
jgi:CheY-like chemotaxis protein